MTLSNHVDATFATAILAIGASIAALEAHSELIAKSPKLREKLTSLHSASCKLAQLLTLEEKESITFEKVQVPEARLKELRLLVTRYAAQSPPQERKVEEQANAQEDSSDDDIHVEELSLSQEELSMLIAGTPQKKEEPKEPVLDEDDDDLIVEEIELSPEELAQLGISR